MPCSLTCGHCQALVHEHRWLKRILGWRLRFRCGLSGRFVAVGDGCTATLHALRQLQQDIERERARRGDADRHTLYTVEGGLGSGRRIYMAHDDRDQGGGCQWRIAQDEQAEG